MSFSSYLDNIAKPFTKFAPWLLRFSLGISFFLHGIGKFPVDRFAGYLGSKDVFLPDFTAILVALGEVGAGIAVIVGGFLGTTGHLVTRLGGGAVVVIMIGAFAIAHPDWFITKDLFMSEQIFLFILGAYFAIKGNN